MQRIHIQENSSSKIAKTINGLKAKERIASGILLGYNAALDSAKGFYIQVQKISLETEQIARTSGHSLTYG